MHWALRASSRPALVKKADPCLRQAGLQPELRPPAAGRQERIRSRDDNSSFGA